MFTARRGVGDGRGAGAGEDPVADRAPGGGVRLREPRQHLRPAGDGLQLPGVGGVDEPGAGRPVTDPEDAQFTVAEGRLLGEPRGPSQGPECVTGTGGVRDAGEIGPDEDEPDPLLVEGGGQAGGRGAGVEGALDPVEAADRLRRHERHGVPDHPRHVEQGLCRFVTGVSPGLAGGGGARQDHRPGVGGRRGVVEPVGGLHPGVRHRPVPALRGERPGPGGGGDDGGEQADRGDRDDGPVRLRVQPGPSTGRGPRRRDPQPAEQVHHADEQREVDEDVEFVEVAQRCPGPVEEGPRLVRHRGERSGEPEDQQPHHQQRQPCRTPRQVTSRQSPQPQDSDRERAGDEDGFGDQGMAGDPFVGEVGGPAGRPAQNLAETEPVRGDPGGFDEVGERRGVPAEDQQRADPPEAGEHAGGQPPAEEPPRGPAHQGRPGTGPGDQPDEDGGQYGGAGGDRVDRPQTQHRDRTAERGARDLPGFRTPPVVCGDQHPHQGREDPGGEGDRPRLRGDGAERGEDAGAQREQDRAGDPGPAGPPVTAEQVEQVEQPEHAGEGGDEQQPPPQPLGEPVGQRVEQCEEQALREQVAVGLVLQLAEGEDVGPGRQRLVEERPGVGDEVVFGVGDGQPGGLQQGHGQPADHGDGPAAAGERRLSRTCHT